MAAFRSVFRRVAMVAVVPCVATSGPFDAMRLSSDELREHVKCSLGEWVSWNEEQLVEWLLKHKPDGFWDSSLGPRPIALR